MIENPEQGTGGQGRPRGLFIRLFLFWFSMVYQEKVILGFPVTVSSHLNNRRPRWPIVKTESLWKNIPYVAEFEKKMVAWVTRFDLIHWSTSKTAWPHGRPRRYHCHSQRVVMCNPSILDPLPDIHNPSPYYYVQEGCVRLAQLQLLRSTLRLEPWGKSSFHLCI